MNSEDFDLKISRPDAWFRDIHINHPLAGFVINHKDRGAFEATFKASDTVITEHGFAGLDHLRGVPIYESPFVNQGEILLIPEEAKRIRREPISIEREVYAEAEVNRRISRWASEYLYKPMFYGHAGLYQAVNPAPYRWERNRNETVNAWGNRLQSRGLLDDPAIRWEYQKAVFKSIGLTLKGWLNVGLHRRS